MPCTYGKSRSCSFACAEKRHGNRASVGGDRMREQPKTAQVADGAFVHAVGELYRLAIRTRPWDTGVGIPAAINALQLGGAYASLSEDDKFQARVVVIGLVTIDRALEVVYAGETNPALGESEDPPSTPPVGLLCASQLLNALLRRSSDPAWRYISALRSLSLGSEAVPAERRPAGAETSSPDSSRRCDGPPRRTAIISRATRRSKWYRKRVDLPISHILSIRPGAGYTGAK